MAKKKEFTDAEIEREILRRSPEYAALPSMLSREEAADFLGCEKKSLDNRKPDVPFEKVGKSVRYAKIDCARVRVLRTFGGAFTQQNSAN